MFYASIGAEVLRIGRVSTSTENFMSPCKKLIKRVIKQGADRFKVVKILNPFPTDLIFRIFKNFTPLPLNGALIKNPFNLNP